ncbi:x-box binding protein [Anaeramoeba flamelloides]|uniref:X-box binding protein n=1 Tax=Anaeramoeba flamelloides TaxID=1746091 RepID=A0AAV7ZZB2_9EUKA|nr:x-box binding protein [Anaeramoeba flamelloides]
MSEKNEQEEEEFPDLMQNFDNFFSEIPEEGLDSFYEQSQIHESEHFLNFEKEKTAGLPKSGSHEVNGYTKNNDNYNKDSNDPPINSYKKETLESTISEQDLSNLYIWKKTNTKEVNKPSIRREGKKVIILKTRKRKKTTKLDKVLEKIKVNKRNKNQKLDSYQEEIKSKFKKKVMVQNLQGEMVDILSPMSKEEFNLLSKSQKAHRKKLQNRISAEASRGRARMRVNDLSEIERSLKKKNKTLSLFVNKLKKEKDQMRQEMIKLKKQVKISNSQNVQLLSSDPNIEKIIGKQNKLLQNNSLQSKNSNQNKSTKENPIFGVFKKMGEKKNEFLQNTKLNKNTLLDSENYQDSLASGFLLIFLICCGILFHNTFAVHFHNKSTTTAFSSRHLFASDKNLILFDDQDYEDYPDFCDDEKHNQNNLFLLKKKNNFENSNQNIFIGESNSQFKYNYNTTLKYCYVN